MMKSFSTPQEISEELHNGSNSAERAIYGLYDDEDGSFLLIQINSINQSDSLYKSCEFTSLYLLKGKFSQTVFSRCIFQDCTFEEVIFNSVVFENCLFQDCQFLHVKFMHPSIHDARFTDCFFVDTEMVGNMMTDTRFMSCVVNDFQLKRVTMTSVVFENTYPSEQGFVIWDSFMSSCYFTSCILTNSKFLACNFKRLSFTDCRMDKYTFAGQNVQSGETFNFIDFQSIVKSEELPIEILKQHFNIHSFDVKDYVKAMTSEVEFQSVFISYSFKDKFFVENLYHKLTEAGVFAFMWSVDAPAGKRQKDIRAEHIQQRDRLLFIASEHSIKSEVCQFELSQARKKQNESWNDVFFPIHIDDFLFRVKKDSIKPKSAQDEYWENIQEIIDFNSIDFSKFTKPGYNESDFEMKVNSLIKSLRKTTT